MTVRLRDDEVRIDEDLVGQLLRTQLPDLANLDLRLVKTQGTENVVFRLWDRNDTRIATTAAAPCPLCDLDHRGAGRGGLSRADARRAGAQP